MRTLTLDRDLPDEREILEELLRKRRIEAWCEETAVDVNKKIRANPAFSLLLFSRRLARQVR
jgi:hypothetical protein